MRLTSFFAHNFRSLVDVRLDDLGEVVWLHGENNAGKSNLLRAVGVWLRLLKGLAEQGKLASGQELVLTPGEEVLEPDAWLGWPYQGLFRHGHRELRLEGRLVDPEKRSLTCELVLMLRSRSAAVRASEPAQVIVTVKSVSVTDEALVFALREAPAGWLHILAERRFQDELWGDGITLPPELAGDGRDLKQRLFSAFTGAERTAYQRFVERFAPLTKGAPFHLGEPRPVQDPQTRLLDLQIGGESVLDQGSGPKQWVLLAGFLAMSQADIIAIEEPEANLSFDAQERVAASLLDVLHDNRYSVQQLFISSHSRLMHRLSDTAPWFEVYKEKGGTRVRRWQGSAGLDQLFPPETPGPRPSESLRLYGGNILMLPESVVQHLRLRPGDYAMPSRNADGTVTLIGEEDFTARERAAAGAAQDNKDAEDD